MFAICVESSHRRGMGHLFRTLNLAPVLWGKQIPFVFLINSDPIAIALLRQKEVPFEVVDLEDVTSAWEPIIIDKYQVDIWINDRMETDIRHSQNVKMRPVRLVTFDDRGSGADLADLHIAALAFKNRHKLEGRRVLIGPEYLILNKEIDQFKRLRTKLDRILVTLGGSDTYGVTVKVVKILQACRKTATIILGPSFAHFEALQEIITEGFTIKTAVTSLIREFQDYDLAISGGGITPFEAGASGLPCIIVANELHEIEIGKYLEKLGCAIFAGYHENICLDPFQQFLDLEEMSRIGMDKVRTDGAVRILGEIKRC